MQTLSDVVIAVENDSNVTLQMMPMGDAPTDVTDDVHQCLVNCLPMIVSRYHCRMKHWNANEPQCHTDFQSEKLLLLLNVDQHRHHSKVLMAILWW